MEQLPTYFLRLVENSSKTDKKLEKNITAACSKRNPGTPGCWRGHHWWWRLCEDPWATGLCVGSGLHTRGCCKTSWCSLWIGKRILQGWSWHHANLYLLLIRTKLQEGRVRWSWVSWNRASAWYNDNNMLFRWFSFDSNRRRRGATCAEINQKACEIANGLSRTWNTLVAGSVSQTEAYERPETRSKQAVKEELTKAMTVLIDNDVDFILLEVRIFNKLL